MMATQKVEPLSRSAAVFITGRTTNEPFEKTPRCSFDLVPGALPQAHIPADADLDAAAAWGITQLRELNGDALARGCMWRDLYALTGLPRTFFGAENVLPAWNDVAKYHNPVEFCLIAGTMGLVQMGPTCSWISARYTFITSGRPPSLCSGQIGLVPDTENVGQWKIWHFSTILESLYGYASPDRFPGNVSTNSNGVVKPPRPGKYDCVVIGAGFAGLCLSARFEALGVNYLTLEKNTRVGDNWRHRYRSATCKYLCRADPALKLCALKILTLLSVHTARDFSDFPLERMFSEADPYFLNTKQLARGYEEYANKHGLVRKRCVFHYRFHLLKTPTEHLDWNHVKNHVVR